MRMKIKPDLTENIASLITTETLNRCYREQKIVKQLLLLLSQLQENSFQTDRVCPEAAGYV